MRSVKKSFIPYQTGSNRGSFSGGQFCSFAIAPVLLSLALMWPFGGGRKVHMMAGTMTPAAHGLIVIKNGPNRNVQLEIKTDALAKPAALTPPANVYVVWLQQPDKEPQNLGQLQVDDHLKGELDTVTPFKRFKIFITAEQNGQTHVPDGPQVLSADISGADT